MRKRNKSDQRDQNENLASEMLITAVRRGELNREVLRKLINMFADLNYSGGHSTPLGICFENEDVDAFELLYSHGARLIIYQYNPEEEVADKYGNQLELELENIEELDTALAIQSIQSGKLKFLDHLVKNRKPDLKEASEWGGGAICCACYENQFDIVKYLLENNLQEIEALDGNQWTPLHVSSQGDGAYEITQYLLERGANIRWINKHKETALHLAEGPKTQKLLLEKSVEKMVEEGCIEWRKWVEYWHLLTGLYEKKIKPHFSQDLDYLLLFALLTQQPREEIFGILELGTKTDLLCQKFGDLCEFAKVFYPSLPAIMEEAVWPDFSNLLVGFSEVVLDPLDNTTVLQPAFLDFSGCALWSKPSKSETSSMEVSSEEDEDGDSNNAVSKGVGKRSFV